MSGIYLDYAATAPLDPAVNEYMYEIGKDLFANPSSLHSAGQRSKVLLERARTLIAESISAHPAEIVFTSGGTESNNYAIIGSALARRGSGNHLISSKIEHPSVLQSFHFLEEQGFNVSYLNIDENGQPDLNELENLLTDHTTLVSLMMVNNETGIIQPVREVAAMLRPRDILFHCDAVQAYGKLPLSVQTLGVDLLSLSAHKIYGPKGCGALYIKKGFKPLKLIYGGAQEFDRRAGTENLCGIAGFAKAVEFIPGLLENVHKLLSLQTLFEMEILHRIPGCEINGRGAGRVPTHSNISFPDHSGESMLINLDRHRIAVSTGSACSSGSSKPSHVLQAMGLSEKRIKNAVRFSFGKQTSESDILETLKILTKLLNSRMRIDMASEK